MKRQLMTSTLLLSMLVPMHQLALGSTSSDSDLGVLFVESTSDSIGNIEEPKFEMDSASSSLSDSELLFIAAPVEGPAVNEPCSPGYLSTMMMAMKDLPAKMKGLPDDVKAVCLGLQSYTAMKAQELKNQAEEKVQNTAARVLECSLSARAKLDECLARMQNLVNVWEVDEAETTTSDEADEANEAGSHS